MKRKAWGRIDVGWEVVLGLLARGNHDVVKQYYLPELPEGVEVNSVHNNPPTLGFSFLLCSENPIEGWTAYQEEGMSIAPSSVSLELRATINKK